MKRCIVTLLVLGCSSYGDIYEDYMKIDQGFNQKFIKNIAENRAANGLRKGEESKGNYVVVNGDEEFKEALKEGQFDTNLTSSKIKKQYIYRDIKNVHIDDKDLDGIVGETLNLGSTTNGGNVVQSLNIENSNIKTDRELNIGITSTSSDVSDITNITNIQDSKLSGGGSKERKSKITTSKDFDN